MRSRLYFWIGLGLLLLAGGWFFWPAGDRQPAATNAAAPQAAAASQPAPAATVVRTVKSASTAPQLFGAAKMATNAVALATKTNLFPHRLANTTKPIGELVHDGRVVLLANAFIDTGANLNLGIPKHLTATGDPGTYIVQSRGPLDAAFRAQLAAAGAVIVSYIPNNAYLVRMSAGGAATMAGQPMTAAVLPYEPYYKLSASLLGAAVEQQVLPTDAVLTLGLFADSAPQTIEQIEKMGGAVVATDHSSFGPIVRVVPPKNWTALAVLTGVQIVEPARQRATANDLARVSLGISIDTVTNANYGGLTGSNVVVEVNDSGIDATHPDFSFGGSAATPGTVPPSRVTGLSPNSITDTNGHGTHVAGIIAGNGSMSLNPTNVGSVAQGSVTNADFRGKAPAATLYSVAALANNQTLNYSDRALQSFPALTNALISNNSWVYADDTVYDLAAASYDAAVRDALPETMGSQPVLFVFAAGNRGGGDNAGNQGEPDTIQSPGTAKNVITVGAIEQLRNITNEVADLDGNTNAIWQAETDNPLEVAGYSARGNVGIGTEGTYGRFKPDVVAPGSFVVSTRSQQWDEVAYYNPTNHHYEGLAGQVVLSNSLTPYSIIVPENAVGVKITLLPNANSPVPFPLLPIYVRQGGSASPGNNDFFTVSNAVSIPPDGGAGYLTLVQNGSFSYSVGNTSTNPAVSYNLLTEITTTNDLGNYYEVLSNLNNTLGPFYRYESGTSMAAPAVSGALALMQDYFTNTLRTTPSPALLKAMLINGARAFGNYNFVVTNGINFQGWGQPSVPNSVPAGITNQFDAPCASFFADQSPDNALATGDERSYLVTVSTNDPNVVIQPLRVTLVWTDPPGDPVAATKLVNNLDLMVSNAVTHEVYWGNNFPRSGLFNSPWNTNAPPVLDTVNNVENVYLPASDGGSYTVTVIGRGVNVNAVTAQTNNVVQDYALVISSGDGGISNALSVAASTLVSHPTDGQLITYVTNSAAAADQTSVAGVLLNQLVGANPALLGTNTISVSPGSIYATNALITLGMTNQWHFYVVTNTTTFTNAAFVTFFPNTLSLPRMGVYEDSELNATRLEADIDLYVTTNAAILNLDPVAIAGADKSLSDGGTEFVVYDNSEANRVYYVGVKSETAEAAEYGFLSVFSQNPFSTMQDGKQIVSGLLLPVAIPDGTPSHPGVALVFALAVMPMEIQSVTVSNRIEHQNFGDLVGVINHNGKNVVLNNHAGLFNVNGVYTNVYNDTGYNLTPGVGPTDGPGSLQDYQGKEAIGPWITTMADTSLTATGAVTAFQLEITPHKDLKEPGVNIILQPGEFFVGYVDVPVGVINLTVGATNTPPTSVPPIELYVSPFVPPTLGDTNTMVLLTNCAIGTYPGGTFAGNSISTGPPLVPGRYFVGLFNPDTIAHDVWVSARLTFSAAAITTSDFASTNSTAIIDDAVSYSSLFVTNRDLVQSFQVGLRVDHPRISDLVFHLISPNGSRFLLMENRGALDTNGAGLTLVTTNTTPVSSSGGPDATTNLVNVGKTVGSVTISWDFYTIPDMMDVYYEGAPIFSSGLVSGSGSTNLLFGPGVSTDLEIVMNASNHPAQTLWTYTVGGVQTNYFYLAFTQDTNLTTTPIKFAPPPFVPPATSTILWSNSFELDPPGAYPNGSTFGSWTVIANQVEIVTNPPAYAGGINSLQLDNGAVRTTLPTVVGGKYILSFQQGSRAFDDISLPVATNANWHPVSVLFTANAANTPLVLNATGSTLASTNGQIFNFDTNALVDAFTLTTVPANLYYQPEEDISDLNNQSAFGLWQLEIQDDRVGAGLTNTLLSWQLEVVYANTNATYPPVITTAATNITSSSATLNALVYPGGLDTTLYFEYGTDSTALTNFSGTFALTDLLTQQALGIPVTNLTADTLYYFQAVTTNSAGTTNYGGVLSFFAHSGPLPYAATLPATLVTGTSAQLNGMATPNGLASVAWFQWGTNTLYGSNTPAVSVGNGFNVVYTNALISGLTMNVPYHFRLVVSNAFAVTYGFDQILDEAYVVAWGANYAGQISVPVGLSNVVAIAAASDHSLALKTNGTAVGWGNNNFGQATVPPALNSNLVAIAGGDSYSMALKSSGTVVVWGAGNLGQTNVPASATNVVNIASGTFSCLALNADGSVLAWGLSFLNVPGGVSNIVALAGGRFHTLALKNDGTVSGWGDNGSGQLSVPTNLNNAVAIAAGSFHSLALRYDGTVVAWGDNSAGQTNVPAGLNNVVAIAAGGFDSLALKSDGTVVGWGDNSAGEISVPLGLTNVTAIAGGLLHSLALAPTLLSSTNPIVLTDGVVVTNTILGGGINYYAVNVPTNADFATNLLFTIITNQTLNLWFSTNTPPSIIQPGDVRLLLNTTNGISILGTNGVPAIVPGATYYLGVQNTNTFAVTYGIGVTFHLLGVTNTPSQTNTIPISNILYTNGGFLLTWFAPSNALFQVQWSDTLPFNWQTFSNIISFNTNAYVGGTNTQFNFFDDGSQAPFTGSRYYQLILLGSAAGNTPPVPPPQSARIINPLNTLVVTNTATDAQSPPQTLTYTLVAPPAGASISTNGVITWTPTVAQAGTSNTITTIVTDSGTPALSATNFFSVLVNPVPVISSVTYSNGNYWVMWLAPTNDIFELQVKTNLASPVWQTLATNITYTGPVTPTNGWFSYLDDGSVVPIGPIRFYNLVLTGVSTASVPVAPAPIVISGIVPIGGGFQLTWFAPTTNQFLVQWTTNLAPPVWMSFPGTNTSITGTFTFTDTNLSSVMKFYQLFLLP